MRCSFANAARRRAAPGYVRRPGAGITHVGTPASSRWASAMSAALPIVQTPNHGPSGSRRRTRASTKSWRLTYSTKCNTRSCGTRSGYGSSVASSPCSTSRLPTASSSRGPTVAIRLDRASIRAFGRRRTLAAVCRLARFSNRLALELASDVYGDDLLDGSAATLDRDAVAAAIPDGGSVLDVGCGDGRWARWLADRASRIVGIDRDPDAIAWARRNTHAANVEFRVGDARELIARPDEVFDIALLVHVLEHIDEPVKFLGELHAVARNVAIEVPDFESDLLNFVRLDLDQPFSSDADHVREYTEQILVDTLAAGGWTVTWLRKRAGRIGVIAS